MTQLSQTGSIGFHYPSKPLLPARIQFGGPKSEDGNSTHSNHSSAVGEDVPYTKKDKAITYNLDGGQATTYLRSGEDEVKIKDLGSKIMLYFYKAGVRVRKAVGG